MLNQEARARLSRICMAATDANIPKAAAARIAHDAMVAAEQVIDRMITAGETEYHERAAEAAFRGETTR